ncbi:MULTISPECIES: DUF1493 family protein [Citrobacter]|jgi:hypothetical protein|uniref:DUF1493 family protein n=1 Tax=Citrobacter TaxID=544 RepID=UPI0010402C04|nr:MULTISPECIES: DUF1493 family protein [Citrobacter]MBR7615337.1 DUF1493 family protein [Citrobacter braakii]MDL4474724.1 DUF1493 family protein [Citrobacter braakii]MDL4506456.1 DUF1493 family protein [Citrobacter braakii]MDM3379853.1 DUF1493 family protein [Citrobacter sp. Cb003]NRF75648.1 DUF1493 family protein [Citrobacter braakii]
MVISIEQRVYELVRPYAGTYLFNHKQVELTPETDLDTDLGIDELEVEDLMNEFFEKLNVERCNFQIETYFPNLPFSWNPFKKTEPVPVPDFTIGMLIESAKAGKWLYD